ncbi:hypothetical protein [Streptomyces sp. SP18BB07]|uniref:hypothetical protein n=1 Tax=Streptomyces sp. SP18BB07 TaxID=3002522 RepID=UPI002E7743E3|nr:hypothetical protein [Streptomyces sp. SP18BB07]MEE1760857.1 hypothetical protein [Streptomyces sp. SP18BB07]
MAIDSSARLAEMFEKPEVKAQADHAVELIAGLAAGDTAKVASLYSGHVDIDDPYDGRGVGDSGLEIVRSWQPARLAEVGEIRLEHYTQADGLGAAELAVDLTKPDGSRVTSKMVVVSELDEKAGRLLRSRLYYRRAWIDGRQHVRLSIKENTIGEITFSNPVIQRYQNALHSGDLAEMAAVFSPDAYLDGHGQSRVLYDKVGMGLYEGRDDVLYCFKQMFDIEGHGDEEAQDHVSVGEIIDRRNVFHDGMTTIMEFCILRPNDPNAPEQAGVAAYELGDDGLLGAARIYDEGW